MIIDVELTMLSIIHNSRACDPLSVIAVERLLIAVKLGPQTTITTTGLWGKNP